MNQTNKKSNRLIEENSPYLLQHAYNPVDWYPWGEEAFAKAKKEDKPIFLSIGYSTCHWCHVMERETFEQDDIAALFNEYFVAIKVDREERPDIDHLYMTFVQTMTGQGGWPMNVFLTPDKKPFYGATYIPPEAQSGMIGIKDLLQAIHKLWTTDRSEAVDYSEKLAARIKDFEDEKAASQEEVDESPVGDLLSFYQREFDEVHGGFSTQPKFLQPHVIRFLLNQFALTKDQRALQMAQQTLEEIYKGGIHDHIGGGYSRYSVDERWLVPHFEKMLYDNAGLLETFALAYGLTGRTCYKDWAKDIVDYIKEVMTDPSGAFYAAEDADSEGVEGKFYVFGYDEVRQVLGDGADEFLRVFDVTPQGNFEGKNILNLLNAPKAALEFIPQTFEPERSQLKAHRAHRVRPHRDDKILASWNGRMISALAQAGRIFREQSYLDQAEAAAKSLQEKLWRAGVLHGSMRLNKVGHAGVLEDYAGYCLGFIDLYEATFKVQYLDHAIEIFDAMTAKFKAKAGGYHLGNENSGLIYNPVDAQDSAAAGGNSLVAQIMLRLSRLTYDEKYTALLKEQFKRFSSNLKEYPQAMAAMVDALALWQGHHRDLILTGPLKKQLIAEFNEALSKRPMNTTLIILAEDSPDFKDHDFLATIPRGEVKLYNCSGRTCGIPLSDPEEIRQMIGTEKGQPLN